MKKIKWLIPMAIAFCIGWISGDTEESSFQNHKQMKRVNSIGGIFFKCKNPAAVREWYEKHLGINTDQYGTNFEWRQAEDSSRSGFTQWAPFSHNTKYFEPSEKDFMINYRVENLQLMVEQLKKEGVMVVDDIENFAYGSFVHILDIEGNKIELWEPDDAEYEKIVEGRTK
jgi:predicted enzyme related to lactoylglutathione lyase